MTTQCTAVCLVRFYLIQRIVSVCANTHMHAHIDTKHDTVIETTSRWHILLQVYNRNELCLTRVTCLMKRHQTSPPTFCYTGRNYSAFCSKFLLPSSCMCFNVYILNCVDTNWEILLMFLPKISVIYVWPSCFTGCLLLYWLES